MTKEFLVSSAARNLVVLTWVAFLASPSYAHKNVRMERKNDDQKSYR
jgi:hypothetical protein